MRGNLNFLRSGKWPNRRSLNHVGVLLIALAFLNGSHELTLRLLYELQVPVHGDSAIYFTIGRGIVHGLVPYRDLFETKPPGVFLLAALSLLISGDGRSAAALQ